MAEHPAGAGSWSVPVTVEADRRAGGFQSVDLALAVNPAGAVALVWERYLSGTTQCCTSAGTKDRLFLAIRPASSSAWRPPVSLGLDGTASGQPGVDPYWYGPHLAINARGTVFVASQWPHRGNYYARATVITPSDRRRKPTFVTFPRPGLEPAIAADDRGYAALMWDSDLSLWRAELSPSAHILDVRRMPGGGGSPQLAADAGGDLAGVWGAAAPRPAGHAWCPAILLTAAAGAYSAAITPDGRGQVVWDDESGAQQVGHGVLRAFTLAYCHAR